VGIAFQLCDDILDVASESSQSGKTPGTDLREGVLTLPMLHALRSAGPGDARLVELLNRGELTDPALHAEALALAASIAGGPTVAHAMTKRMLHQEWDMSVDAAIDAEAQAQAICMQTRDFERAYRAFVAKQAPAFEGT
jgi:geranylgeranyl pyrophosphate synthase